MKRRRRWYKHNPKLEFEYDRAVKTQDYDKALEVGLKLGYGPDAISARLEIQGREIQRARIQGSEIQRTRIQEREERRLAIARRYGVPVSWVRLEGDFVIHQAAAAKPERSVLASLRATAKVVLHAVAVLLLQAGRN